MSFCFACTILQHIVSFAKALQCPCSFCHRQAHYAVKIAVDVLHQQCTDVYDPTSEGGIPYDDPTVNVQWPDCGCEHKTSAKDKLHEPFAAQKFEYFEKW